MIYETIITSVINAGRALLSAHDVESELLVKAGDDNFATVWDLATQHRLIGELSSLIPDALFLAEEEADEADALAHVFTDTVPETGRCLVIDPIDGTTNFMHGMSHSAVSVALIENGVTVFGCVYNPWLDECFHATLGGGAFLRTSAGDGFIDTPISVSSRPLPDSLVAFGTTPYDKTHAEATFSLVCDFFRICRDVRRCGSAALDVCYVAIGRYDAFFELTLSPWDFASGALILREAGGILTDMNGSPIATAEKSSVLAANPICHAEALAIIAAAH